MFATKWQLKSNFKLHYLLYYLINCKAINCKSELSRANNKITPNKGSQLC